MNVMTEKLLKLLRYVKLEILFARKNEFGTIHPELKKLWKRKFQQMIRYSSDRTFPIVEEFLSVKIDKISEREKI